MSGMWKRGEHGVNSSLGVKRKLEENEERERESVCVYVCSIMLKMLSASSL